MDELDRNYVEAGFGINVGFGSRPALVVVDFVKAYLEPSSPLYAGVEEAVEPARKVLEAARGACAPIAFTQVVYSAGGRDGGYFFKKVKPLELFVGRSEMGEIVDELTPQPDEIVIHKQYPSAFFGSSLAATLTSLGVDTVVVTGLSTSGCVRATVVDAISYGFMPVVVRDAVGDRDARPHEANLFDMRAKYADLVRADEAVAYFEKVAT
jgi:maleamate amidohydrolase